MDKKILLKDLLFNKTKVEQIAEEINLVYSEFQKNNFVCEVANKFPDLELKARISWIAQCLKKYLPSDYKNALSIIIKALPAPNNPDLADNDFGDFIYAPYAEFVAQNGRDKSNLDFSLKALYEITQRFSAEDAIRYYINAFPQETIAQLQKWSKDANYHVRRLCSEGTRPKLPWSQKINISADIPISILDNLFSDSKRYVTRSVANHLNDISKIDVDLTIKTLERWKNSQKQTATEMDYIIRHALRSLIKIGDIRAMNFLGVSYKPNLELLDLKVLPEVKINNALEFYFTLRANEDVKIIVDYVIYFCNKVGEISGHKVFKLKNLNLSKGQSQSIAKRHMLRSNMTTRKIYAGRHFVEIKINGQSFAKKSFQILFSVS